MTVALATPLLFLLHLFASVPQATQRPSFVAERSPSYSFKDGIHELGSGQGWLRTTGVYLNFRAALDFKTMTPDSDAGVLFRTWTGTDEWPGRGYRFRLPSESAASPSSLVVGHRAKVTIVQDGRIDLQPSGEWQQVEIVGDGRRITLTLNRTLVGVFEVERYGGHILVRQQKRAECS